MENSKLNKTTDKIASDSFGHMFNDMIWHACKLNKQLNFNSKINANDLDCVTQNKLDNNLVACFIG